MPEARTEPTAGAVSGAAMDRIVVTRPRWPRRVALALGALALVVGGYLVVRPASQRSLAVQGSHVTLGKVTRGRFDDIISVRGRVTPLRTTFVDTASGGQVEAIRVEDGATVERGQLLVELSNTGLQLDLISREAQITEQLNALRGLELAQEQTRLTHEREMVELRYQIKRLTRQIEASTPVVEAGGSPRIELDNQRDELEYYQQRLAVQTRTRASADRLQQAQLVQMRAAAKQLEANLAIARDNLERLKVKAPISGKLSAFNLEVGQSLGAGDRIGQIDDPERFKVVADLDEFYLARVEVGQPAQYLVGATTYRLAVSKIRPQVANAQFQVELTFEGEAPAAGAIRRGQTAQIALQLGQPSEALLIPNAAFYNDTGGAWVFVVSGDHSHAVRRTVRLGRRNPQQIEVLDGLTAGEEIVTSPYTSYLDMDRLQLTR